MSQGVPTKPIQCATCQKLFMRTNSPQKYCSAGCHLDGRTDKTPGHGPEGRCWIWTGGRNRRLGYGQIKVGGHAQLAHRLAFELIYGSIPSDICVCHTCDVPICVNPTHLFLGTHQDNMDDCGRKDRRAKGEEHGLKVAGERHGQAKLSYGVVQDILRRYACGGITQRELAEEYGVHQTRISRIVRGKAWKYSCSEGYTSKESPKASIVDV